MLTARPPWRLVAPRDDKVLEVVESDAGPRIRLSRAGSREPYFDAALAEMLSVSVGRPWRPAFPGLASHQVEQLPDVLALSADVGGLRVATTLRFRDDLLRIDLEWRQAGAGPPLRDVAVGLVLPLPALVGERVTIPNVIYNDNPSADPFRAVPRIGTRPGGGYVCEEHRLPIPGVDVEWQASEGSRQLTLLSLPAAREDEDGRVHYGSLGALRSGPGLSVLAMSGVVMFDGEPDVAYVHKGATAPYDDGYLHVDTDFALRRSHVLDWGDVGRPGQGFRTLVKDGLRLFEPGGARPMELAELVRYKTNAMDARWLTARSAAGYLKFPAWGEPSRSRRAPRDFLYGWTGQCLRLAWCDAKLGLTGDEPDRVERCRKAVDFYVAGSETGVPGLRMNSYLVDRDRWIPFRRDGHDMVSSRAHGETLCDIADIVELFREYDEPVPDSWVSALEAGADFVAGSLLPVGIPPLGWRPDGSPHTDLVCAAGIPAALALSRTFAVTGRQKYLRAAQDTAERYHELHTETFDRPFARSTLDAACEDKEGGLYYFLSAYDLLLRTGEERYRERAVLAADWLLTFVYAWNPEYDRGSPFRQRDFRAVGWPGVSVQNHHLDVFFPTYELWSLGRRIGNQRYVELAETIMHAMGQGICTQEGDWGFPVVGEQAEGFFQTNWQRRGESNTWNPSWVIALPLWHALRMRADG